MYYWKRQLKFLTINHEDPIFTHILITPHNIFSQELPFDSFLKFRNISLIVYKHVLDGKLKSFIIPVAHLFGGERRGWRCRVDGGRTLVAGCQKNHETVLLQKKTIKFWYTFFTYKITNWKIMAYTMMRTQNDKFMRNMMYLGFEPHYRKKSL